MKLKIIGTTDNKYLGLDFGEGHFRYSNSNYVIDAIEVEN
jgi:hypothetical protein